MRKLLAITLALCCLFSSVAFAAEIKTETPEEMNFVGPYILTSAGQSADFQMVKAMLKMNKVENYSEDALLKPETMPEDVGTIIIVIGGSSKGLGAAGIDADQELDRLINVMNFAKENDIPILAMHIGGSARRVTYPINLSSLLLQKLKYALWLRKLMRWTICLMLCLKNMTFL